MIPRNIMVSMCDIPPRGLKMSSNLIANSTAVSEVYERVLKNFNLLSSRKAFYHWYTLEGYEESEFGAV